MPVANDYVDFKPILVSYIVFLSLTNFLIKLGITYVYRNISYFSNFCKSSINFDTDIKYVLSLVYRSSTRP